MERITGDNSDRSGNIENVWVPGEAVDASAAKPFNITVTSASHRRRSNKTPADYLRIVWNRKWTAASVLLASLILSILYCILSTPIYRSNATIEIDEELKKSLNLGNLGDAIKGVDSKEYHFTQLEILKSRALIEKLIKKMNLQEWPEFQVKKSGAFQELGKSLGALFAGKNEMSDASPDTDQAVYNEQLIDELMGRISVNSVGKSRIVNIQMEAEDRRLANLLLKNFVDIYLQHNLGKRRSESLDAAYWLKSELAAVEKELATSRAKLIEFTTKHGVVSLDKDLNHVVTSFSAAADGLVKSKEGRIKLQAFQKQEGLKDLHNLPTNVHMEHVMKMKEQLAALESEYAQITAVYDAGYPKAVVLKKKIDELRKRILSTEESALSAAVEVAKKEEELVGDAFEKAKKKAIDLNSLGVEHAILQKEVDTNQAVYQLFLQKAKEMEVTAGVTGNNISIILPPTMPHKPVRPKKALTLLLGTLVGLLGGIVAAIIKDSTDQTIKNADQVQSFLRVPSLGVIPDIRDLKKFHPGATKKSGYEFIAHHQPKSPLYDALKNIQTSIFLTSDNNGSMVLAVSSACPQEGKTLVAVAMASTMCDDKAQVLLVDCDLRRPRIHKIFGFNRHHVGLTNFLSQQNTKLEEIARPTFLDNLDVVTCGPLPDNPVTLFQSSRMSEFLNQSKSYYNFVILDCPPILGFSDTRFLSSYTDGILFVVREGYYARKLLKDAVNSILLSRGKIVGAVLNMTHPHSSDYMSYRYNRRFNYYS